MIQMVSQNKIKNRKWAETFHQKIAVRIEAVEEPLDFKKGCLYCFKKRQLGSLFCSEECEHDYLWLNNKQKEELTGGNLR